MPTRPRSLAVSAAVVSALGLAAGSLLLAPADPVAAAVGARGPSYSVPTKQLAASFECQGSLRGSAEQPVLLVHGTGLTADTNFDWNYENALPGQLGRTTCTVDLPGSGMLDVPTAAEHVTYAIRRMNRGSGQLVDVVGYSQGGMLPRWSLKYWPDTRDRVDDVVGIDPSNHGTLDSQITCQPATGCPPAFWQQASFSTFITTLNEGPETFAGIDYTVVYTVTDEVVAPNLPPAASSELDGPADRVANIPVQQLCPVHVAEHLSMGTTDPIGYAVVADALVHDGPADAARTLEDDPALCARDVMPGVDRTRLPANIVRTTGQLSTAVATAPRTRSEPPLPAYAR